MIPKIGTHIERIDKIDSTNNYAAKLLLTKRPLEGWVILAGRQIGGRGQGANKWESEPYSNLTFSIILYPDFIAVSRQFEISKAISLGVADFLMDYAEYVSIKWPNDIYIGRSKVAGILMEYSILKNKISSCIVGIGLNINQITFLSDAPNPISLSQVTGTTYNLDECLSILLQKLDFRYQQLATSQYDNIDREYEQLLYLRNDWALYSSKNEEFEGRILGVDENGLLKIETRQRTILKFDYKEVSFRN
jgi:BirA family transcriptional regulator, biotin operon repressor / biotin---[acetyl-CoA-carboxylase] ligase